MGETYSHHLSNNFYLDLTKSEVDVVINSLGILLYIYFGTLGVYLQGYRIILDIKHVDLDL